MKQITVNTKNNDLNPIIAEVIKSKEPQAKFKNINIQFSPNITINAFFDADMIAIVVRNLILNAIKFSYPNQKIIIQSNTINTFAEVFIHNFGIGFDDRNLQKTLNTKNPISTKGTEHEMGSGIGLLICREFIEKNNGTISSSLGNECEIRITLPIKTIITD